MPEDPKDVAEFNEALAKAQVEAAQNTAVFLHKHCPLAGESCIKEKCWCWRGFKEFWAEERKIVKDGHESYERTGRVLFGEVTSCDFKILPHRMILSVENAGPNYKIDEMGRIIGPGGPLDPLADHQLEETNGADL